MQWMKEWNDIRTKTYSFVAGDVSDNLFAIESVTDVPDDEGSVVELTFLANQYDSVGMITHYQVFMNVFGYWDLVDEIQPTGEDTYSLQIEIPNEYNWYGEVSAQFKVVSVYTFNFSLESNIMEGIAIDNLAPAIPADFSAEAIEGGKAVAISWTNNEESDFSHYILYRNGEEYWYAYETNLIDYEVRNGTYKYAIQAVDSHGNYSDLSTEIEVTIDGYVDFEIYDVAVKPNSETSVIVFWKTTIPSDGYIVYGKESNPDEYEFLSEEWTGLQMNHSMTIEQLETGETYYFVIEQYDNDGYMASTEELSFVAGNINEGALTISSIVDVPEDQGGWVYVNFEADILDGVGEILRYGVWEWLEDKWVSLGSVPATQAESYSFLAHTNADMVGDFINWSKFFVSAHTANPMLYYSSAPDSGYSIDNIIPAVPLGVVAQLNVESKSVVLNWNDNPDIDLQYYKIYRDDILLEVTSVPSFEDFAIVNETYDYNISAVDIHGNESDLSETLHVITVGVQQLNVEQGLSISNYPNPVLESTTFKVIAHDSGKLKIEIFDVNGKRINVLFDGVPLNQMFEVQYNVEELEKGVYYYMLTSEQKTIMHKLIVQ